MNMHGRRLSAAEQSGGISSSAIYQAVLSAASAACPQPATVLDFGSGTGQLLLQLRETFPLAVLHAIDIMPKPENLPCPVTWHQSDLNHPSPLEQGRFSLIVAAEVIEHLENPREMLRQLFGLLMPGGAAVLSTPNPASWRSLLTLAVRGHHAQFDDTNYPAHIMSVGEVDLRRMGNETGLKLERVFYTNRGTIPKLLHRHWQDLPLVGGGFAGRRYSDNFGAVFRKSASMPQN